VRDPDDDHVIACAFAVQAEVVVSYDTDLLSLRTYQSVVILTAAEALRRIATE